MGRDERDELSPLGRNPLGFAHETLLSVCQWVTKNATTLRTSGQRRLNLRFRRAHNPEVVAIEQLKAKRLQNLEDVKRQGEQAAEGQAKQIVMDAAHAAVLEQAAADAEKIKEENATKIAQLKASYELEVLQARRDAERTFWPLIKEPQTTDATSTQLKRLRWGGVAQPF